VYFSLKGKQARREDGHLLPSNVEVENRWRTFLHIVLYLNGVHRDDVAAMVSARMTKACCFCVAGC
jgi:hypothetical protein